MGPVQRQSDYRAGGPAGFRHSAHRVSAAQPTLAWNNPGTPPLPKIDQVLAKDEAAGQEARAAVTETLLRNVYRGFDYYSESDVYDALAQSVHGELLTHLYLKIKQSLTVQEQGGAVAKVQEVKVVKAEAGTTDVKDGFSQRVTWQVTGAIEHWGHIHQRVSQYTAEIGVAPVDGAWKIVSLNVTRQSQIRNAVSLRKL